MARPERLDCPAELIARSFSGQLLLDRGGHRRDRADFLRFTGTGPQGGSLNRPDGYADWLVREMAGAGQILDEGAARHVATAVFAADLFLKAGL